MKVKNPIIKLMILITMSVASQSAFSRAQDCNIGSPNFPDCLDVPPPDLSSPPDRPSSITIPSSPTPYRDYTIRWSSSSGATSYELQEKYNGVWGTRETLSPSPTQKNYNNKPDGDYYYRVRACNSEGCSSYRQSSLLEVTYVPPPPPVVESGYQRSFYYLGNSAHDKERGDVFNDAQGVANGKNASDPYWFFSTVDKLSRVKYDQYLDNNFAYDLKSVALPSGLTCDHIGDIKYYYINGSGWILAPMNGDCGGADAIIAFFKTSDFNNSGNTITARTFLDISSHQSGAYWVTVDRLGNIYSSQNERDYISKYTINWNHVGVYTEITFSNPRAVNLINGSGGPFNILRAQGGDFSADGSLFYLAVGYNTESGSKNPDRAIHAFEVVDSLNFEWIRKSSSAMPFKYEVNGGKLAGQEPQGLSWYDTRLISEYSYYHYNMPRGELHAVLFNDEIIGDDGIYLKHFTSVIEVENGEDIYDYLDNDVSDIWQGHGAWHGSVIIDHNTNTNFPGDFWGVSYISRDSEEIKVIHDPE